MRRNRMLRMNSGLMSVGSQNSGVDSDEWESSSESDSDLSIGASVASESMSLPVIEQEATGTASQAGASSSSSDLEGGNPSLDLVLLTYDREPLDKDIPEYCNLVIQAWDLTLPSGFEAVKTVDVSTDAEHPSLLQYHRASNVYHFNIPSLELANVRLKAIVQDDKGKRATVVGELPVAWATDTPGEVSEFEVQRHIRNSEDGNVLIFKVRVLVIETDVDQVKSPKKMKTKNGAGSGKGGTSRKTTRFEHTRAELLQLAGSHEEAYVARSDAAHTVWVQELPTDATNEEVWNYFEGAGPIKYVQILQKPLVGMESDAFVANTQAVVVFTEALGASNAVDFFHGNMFKSEIMNVMPLPECGAIVNDDSAAVAYKEVAARQGSDDDGDDDGVGSAASGSPRSSGDDLGRHRDGAALLSVNERTEVDKYEADKMKRYRDAAGGVGSGLDLWSQAYEMRQLGKPVPGLSTPPPESGRAMDAGLSEDGSTSTRSFSMVKISEGSNSSVVREIVRSDTGNSVAVAPVTEYSKHGDGWSCWDADDVADCCNACNPMRLKEADTSVQLAVACCYCFVLIIGVILFAVSFQLLTPAEMGLDYNSYAVTIDETKVYGGGRHFLGLGHSFVRYPSTLVYVEFSTNTTTATSGQLFAASSSGQPILITASAYVRLQRENLVRLYKALSTGYMASVVRIFAQSVKNVAVRFDTLEYFTNRTVIGDAMTSEVRKDLRSIYVDLVDMQLRAIDLPDNLEEKLLTKVVTEQQEKTKTLEQAVSVVRAETRVIESAANATITRVMGTANGTAIRLFADARAAATLVMENARKRAFGALQSKLNFTDNQLREYMYVREDVWGADRLQDLILGFGLDQMGAGFNATVNGTATAAESNTRTFIVHPNE